MKQLLVRGVMRRGVMRMRMVMMRNDCKTRWVMRRERGRAVDTIGTVLAIRARVGEISTETRQAVR